jgi:tetratricopeptide (TPR) repeat protein
VGSEIHSLSAYWGPSCADVDVFLHVARNFANLAVVEIREVGKMSRFIAIGFCKLALALVAATIPTSASAYFSLEDGNYSDYGGTPYPYLENRTIPRQSNAAVQPPRQTNPTADNVQGKQYLDEALQSFRAGNYQNAMRMAEHAIVDSPRDTEAHEIVSLAAFANRDYRTAATEARAVADLGGVPSWNQVYAIYQNVDAYTLQLRSLEDYVRAYPQSADGQFLLGIQYMTTGHANDAHEHLAKAAELTPKDKIVQNLIEVAGGETPMTATRVDATAAKK